MKNHPFAHRMLVCAASREEAMRQVRHFFCHNQLVVYSEISIVAEEMQNAESTQFWRNLEQGLAANRAFGKEMLGLLEKEGYARLSDLLDLMPGYPTKVLHILTHLLDGFMGVDSALYNLVEDAHALSAGLRDRMRADPASYWLVPVWAGGLRTSILPSL